MQTMARSWNALPNYEGESIWNCDDDDDDDDPPTGKDEATIQQEEVSKPDTRGIVESLEKPLTDKQVQMIGNLFHSHFCMLEYQAHTSLLLVKLVKSLNLISYYMVLKAQSPLTKWPSQMNCI